LPGSQVVSLASDYLANARPHQSIEAAKFYATFWSVAVSNQAN